MSRYAVWRKRPEDPKGVLRWVFWGDRHLPEIKRRRLGQLILLALTVGTLLALCPEPVLLFPYILLAWVGLAIYARPGADEHANLPVLGGTEAYPVTICISQRGRRLGRENGWVAFVDGWLVYEGLRTSFSLRTADAQEVYDFAGNLFVKLPEGRILRMFLLTDAMQTTRPGRWRDRRRILEAFDEWRNAPVPQGDPVQPPQETSLRIRGEIIGERLMLVLVTGLLGFATTMFLMPWAALFAVAWIGLVIDTYRRIRCMKRMLNEVASPALGAIRERPSPSPEPFLSTE